MPSAVLLFMKPRRSTKLFSDDEDGKGIGQHGAATAASETSTASGLGGAAAAGGASGTGPNWAAMVRTWFVFVSSVSVLAPAMVSRFCSTSKVVGLVSFTTVRVPLPCVLKASMVAGLNVAPSDEPARGRAVRILPSFALRITIIGFAGWAGGMPEFRAATKRTPFFASIARPAKPLPWSPRS